MIDRYSATFPCEHRPADVLSLSGPCDAIRRLSFGKQSKVSR